MQFHEISCVGKLWINRVATLPTWTSNDVGRLLFAINKNSVYYGGTIEHAGWINVSEYFIDEGTATDPVAGTSYTGRDYQQKIVNGNIRLYY